MDFDREGLAVVCYTDRGIVKGRVSLPDLPPVTDAFQVNRGGPSLLHLIDASVLDSEFRVIHRARELAVNKDAIVFAYEDEAAGDLQRLKGMITKEDYDTAAAEIDRLLLTSQRDAELFYLAGLVFEHTDAESRARDCFQRALELVLDDKFRAVIRSHLA